MALPMIPSALFAFLPSSLIMGFMTSAAESDSLKTDVIAVYTILLKILMTGVALPMALSIGFLTAATHSMAQKNMKRMLITLVYAIATIGIYFIFFIPFMIFKPSLFMKLFGITSKSQLDIAKKMVPIPFYTFAIGNICVFLFNFFVAVGKPLYSNLASSVQLISICLGAKVLYVKFSHDPLKQMYAYIISDLSTIVLTVALFLITLIPFIKQLKKSNENKNQKLFH